jgi:signal transduction histidine kinase
MATDDRRARPERDRTDESLRTERERTDRALAERQTAVQNDADEVVQIARDNADDLLAAERDRADLQGQEAESADSARAGIEEGRALEDEALRAERAAADESLRLARAESARALAKLLPLERDKTDRFLLTERARSDDEVSNRDDFLGIVSHDLRNLLGGIVLNATLLADGARGDGRAATLAGTARIERYAARMNRLIGDLVDVASIDAGELAVAPSQGDATVLVAEAVDLFQGLAAAKQITIRSDIVGPLPCTFDHDRLLQVLANLITNAIKFTPNGGQITVRGGRAGDAVQLSIADTGCGIEGTKLEVVFERFWQAAKGDRRGVGLGLYISRCIVEAHGGRIWAESAPGAGSTFHFSLPA